MSDNPVLPATGTAVRAIDRVADATAPPATPSGVTQVVQLDVAGATGPESLVNANNPLPTNDVPTAAAQTSDAPQFVAITGDPNGDFAGVNILEKLVDDAGDLKIAVRVVNPPKQDVQGAQMVSDAPAPIPFSLMGTGQSIVFDTTGYQSIQITVPSVGGFAGASAASSNDGITWSATLGFFVTSVASSPAATAGSGGTYVFPVLGKYFRLTQTGGSGSAVAYLRNIPAPNPAVIMPQNVAQWSGAVPVSAGVSGVVSVGGPTANATAPTANPNLIAGIDSGTPGTLLGVPLTRRVLTDNAGRIRLAEESPVQTPQNIASLSVQDTSQIDGQSVIELLAQILLELRIANQQRYELPAVLGQTLVMSMQSASTVLTPNSLPDWDDPSAYRSEPTIFN